MWLVEVSDRWRYLVRFVVVLWIVFEDFGLLHVVEVPHQIVGTEVFPPFFALNEPGE